MPAEPSDQLRIVLTGGPGGGKTTAADLFRREIGDHVIVVPESATILFAGGFPRTSEPEAARATQQAVYHLQRNLEDVQAARFPDRVLLCDRGTVDGAAYWPDGRDGFFEAMGTTYAADLARYDVVIFFETAAVGGHRFESGNRFRTESNEEAVALDARLRTLWSAHPHFHLVPHASSFLHKINEGLAILQRVVDEHRSTRGQHPQEQPPP